jgi:hypothetical protein
MNILEKIIKKEIEKAFLILEKKKIIYDDFNQNNDPNKSLDLSQSNTSNNDFTKMEDLESNLPNETINSNDNLPLRPIIMVVNSGSKKMASSTLLRYF